MSRVFQAYLADFIINEANFRQNIERNSYGSHKLTEKPRIWGEFFSGFYRKETKLQTLQGKKFMSHLEFIDHEKAYERENREGLSCFHESYEIEESYRLTLSFCEKK